MIDTTKVVVNFLYDAHTGKYSISHPNMETTKVSFRLFLGDETEHNVRLTIPVETAHADWINDLLDDDLVEGIKKVFELHKQGRIYSTGDSDIEPFKTAFREHLDQIVEIDYANKIVKDKKRIVKYEEHITHVKGHLKGLEASYSYQMQEPYETAPDDLFPEVTLEGQLDALTKRLARNAESVTTSKEKVEQTEKDVEEIKKKIQELEDLKAEEDKK